MDETVNVRKGLESSVRDGDEGVIANADEIADGFEDFQVVTGEQRQKTVAKLLSGSWELDPVPKVMLNKYVRSLSHVSTKMANISSSNEAFATSLKTATVKPLIRKSNMDLDQLKKYRLVSDLPTLSEIIEKTGSHALKTSHVDKST